MIELPDVGELSWIHGLFFGKTGFGRKFMCLSSCFGWVGVLLDGRGFHVFFCWIQIVFVFFCFKDYEYII